jgi:hypothetical protein
LDSQNTIVEPECLPEHAPEKAAPDAPRGLLQSLDTEEKKMNKWLNERHLGCFRPFGLIHGVYSIVKSKHPIGWKITIFAGSLLILILFLMIVFRELNFVNLLFPWA